MAAHIPKLPAEYLSPLNMNGLRGRMLRLPSKRPKKKREILFVYGHHTSLERIYGFAEVLADYGNVTVPDLPGFGGMDSFYQIGEVPNIDTLADYLAAFVKLRYRGRRMTLVGSSLGFVILTRMLQNYPELVKKTDMVVSLAGFARHDDFNFTKRRILAYRTFPRLFEFRVPAVLFRNIALHPSVIRAVYHRLDNAKDKFEDLDTEQRRAVTDFEVFLWRCNDVRTYMKTTREMFGLDNCKSRIPLPAWHVSVPGDKYINNQIAEQHLAVIYSNVTSVAANSNKHMPGVIANKDEATVFFPRKLKAALNK